MPDRPKDMLRNGRPVVPDFDQDEVLYHRTDPNFIQPDGTVDAVHITFRFPDLSSNRSKFSEPWYVLYPRSEYGGMAVIKCRCQDIPPSVQGDGKDSPIHKVKAEHDPLDDNYGHCETRIYKNDKRLTRPNQLKDGPKARLRLAFSKIVRVERSGGEPFPPDGWVDPSPPHLSD
jgi:hypothetical protein